MKTYLEIKENLTEVEKADGIQPQEIRLLMADKAEAISKLPLYEPIFDGLDYSKKVHYCNHPNGACTSEDL